MECSIKVMSNLQGIQKAMGHTLLLLQQGDQLAWQACMTLPWELLEAGFHQLVLLCTKYAGQTVVGTLTFLQRLMMQLLMALTLSPFQLET
jgi:hypothetical protein